MFTPNHEQLLVKALTLTVPSGEGLMIVGLSGAGKSSLLRAIPGLWSTGPGHITRPGGTVMLCLPQQPYLPLGDLRCQLTYPQADNTFSDGDLLQWLARVNLPTLVERFGGLDAELDWARVLSVGEQKRPVFARALLTNPPARWTPPTKICCMASWLRCTSPPSASATTTPLPSTTATPLSCMAMRVGR